MGHRTFSVISAREPKDGRDSKIAVEIDSWRKVNCEEPQPSLHISFLGREQNFPSGGGSLQLGESTSRLLTK